MRDDTMARPSPLFPPRDAARALGRPRDAGMSDPGFTLASWNLHRGRGNDGVTDAGRTAEVLLSEVWCPGTDALILQEADEDAPPHAAFLDMARIEAGTGLRSVHDRPGRRWGADSHGFLGVIVLLHPEFEVEEVALLDLPGRCHRGAVVVDATRRGRALRLVGTHLSLSQPLRVAQMRTLGQHLFRRPARPAILAGDFNEWRPWGGLAFSPRVVGARLTGPVRPSFPTRRPVLPLDRVLAEAPARVEETEVLDGPGIRMASDHRPLRARIGFGR
jgi:endonuclease/exonuclease/phosphatase family metal-dependent hydrolase